MKHTRRLSALLLATLLLTSSVACTGKGNGTATTEGDDTQAEATESSSQEETSAMTDAPPGIKAEPTQLSFTPSVTVTEAQDSAAVTHEDGLSYTATGYTSARNNLLTFTNHVGFDPEYLGMTTQGTYPGTRQYTAGLELTF